MKLRSIIIWATSIALLVTVSAGAQPTKLPTADEVKALQTKYQAERDKVVKAGIAKRFLPAIMEKADELAKKSDTALAGGRLLQAAEAIRQARWQLPYQPVGVPDNVSRIIGNLRLRHSREINVVAFSPDGTKLATASADYTVKIWDLENGQDILTYMGHTDKVLGLAWSPDGKWIVSAGKEKNIKIWNSTTGKDEQVIVATGDQVSSLALSKDGKHVFTGQHKVKDLPGGIFVYETKGGKLVRDVRDFTNKLDAIAVNTEGNIVAVGDDNGNVRLFQYPNFVDNVNQPAYWAQQDASGPTYHLAFSPDDKTLVRCSSYTVKLFATPQPGAPFAVGAARATINVDGTRFATFSRDSKTLFTGNNKGAITFWNPEDGNKIGEFKNAHAGHITGLAFSPEGNQLASCAGDFIVRLWPFDIVLQSRDFEGHEGPVWSAGFNSDATKMISASADKTVKVWQRDTGAVLFNITDHTAPVTVAMFSPDNNLIASAGGDKVVRIFDAVKGKQLRTCEGHTGTITFLDFSRDSKKIVSCGVDRKIKVWDAEKGTELKSIDDNPSIASSVAFSPDGKQIAVGNIDQTVRLYDADTGKLQHSWNAHGTAVNGVAYSPDGKNLASCGADTTVAVWPLSTPGANSIRLTGHGGPVSTVAFRMDNIHLVSCGADQLIKLWKIEGNSGKEVNTFRGHKDWVTNVAFSKDGFYVVSSSVDRKVKIWEITSRELPLLAEHSSAVDSIAISPNGEIIATGSSDRTIKLWDRKTGLEIATLTGHIRAIMSMVFTPDGKRLISSSAGDDPRVAEVRFWEISPPREIERTKQQLNFLGQGKFRQTSPYIAVDPTGKTLMAWFPIRDAKNTTIVDAYDIATGTPVWDGPKDTPWDGKPIFQESDRKVNCLSIAANGKVAVTGGKDGSVGVWNLDEVAAFAAKKTNDKPGPDIKNPWYLFEKDKTEVMDIALTSDGATLVAAGKNGEIKIAKVQGREILHTIKGHKSKIEACVLSPDGRFFATVDSDNVVKAWTIDGKEVRSWDMGRHNDMFVIALAFSPDNKQLVSANANTTVYVLDLP